MEESGEKLLSLGPISSEGINPDWKEGKPRAFDHRGLVLELGFLGLVDCRTCGGPRAGWIKGMHRGKVTSGCPATVPWGDKQIYGTLLPDHRDLQLRGKSSHGRNVLHGGNTGVMARPEARELARNQVVTVKVQTGPAELERRPHQLGGSELGDPVETSAAGETPHPPERAPALRCVRP